MGTLHLFLCVFVFPPDVAEHDLTPVPAGPPSDVTAAALLPDWLEPRQPQPGTGVSPPP